MKCNNRARVEALEPRYKWRCQGNRCYYCNDTADTVDHAPALDVAYSLGVDWLERNGSKLWKAPACRQCNSILGSLPILTLEERATYIYENLIRKYRKALQGRDFDWEELAEYGPNLRSYLQVHWGIRGWVERRLSYMEAVFGLSLDPFDEEVV